MAQLVVVQLPDPYKWAGDSRFVVATGVLVVFAAFVYLYCEKLARAPIGRTLRAIRDNETSSEALGKDDVGIRRKTLMIASAISGIAGLLYSFYTVDVLPATFGRVIWTFWPWVMVIMGGAANNLGVLLGTGIFVTSRKLIDLYKYSLGSFLPFNVVWLDRLGLGIVLLIMLIVRPQGILAERPQMPLGREKILAVMARVKKTPNPQKPAK